MFKVYTYFHRYIPVDESEFAQELVEELRKLKQREKKHHKFSIHSEIVKDSKNVSRFSKNVENLELISNAKN